MARLANDVDITLDKIGLPTLSQPLFYQSRVGLRMEISDPKANTKDITTLHNAFDRAFAIYEKLAKNFTILRINLFYEMEDSEEIRNEDRAFDLGIICSATGLPLPMEERNSTTTIKDDKGRRTELFQVECYWDLSDVAFDHRALIMEIILTDFPEHNGNHQFESAVHFVDTVDHLILHLYDDRGMDILSSSEEYLYGIYRDFNTWILDHDRPRINQVFRSYRDFLMQSSIDVNQYSLDLSHISSD